MCRYQTLYHDERAGYVVKCVECGRLQVGFMNLMLVFNDEDFHAFRCWLKKIKRDKESCQNEIIRSIIIPTPCEGVRLMVSYRELTDFDNMLETADSELKSLELIKLFDSH